jgi:hypothetical protein
MKRLMKYGSTLILLGLVVVLVAPRVLQALPGEEIIILSAPFPELSNWNAAVDKGSNQTIRGDKDFYGDIKYEGTAIRWSATITTAALNTGASRYIVSPVTGHVSLILAAPNLAVGGTATHLSFRVGGRNLETTDLGGTTNNLHIPAGTAVGALLLTSISSGDLRQSRVDQYDRISVSPRGNGANAATVNVTIIITD